MHGTQDAVTGVDLVDHDTEGVDVHDFVERSALAAHLLINAVKVLLATHYLAHGSEQHARRIYQDMRGERRERIDSIRAELEAVTDQEYWEVSDRGINFEWLPDDRRAELPRFFSWFDAPPPALH